MMGVLQLAFGFTGKILRVDLTAGTCTVEEKDEVFYRRYMGGGLLGSYYLLRELKPGCDPLGPDNVIVFAPSVITGAPVAGISRYSIVAKSPLTGGFGESEAGGWFAPELKKTGFDAIIVRGRAPRPVYLWVHDGEAEIRDASRLWGLTTAETDAAIRSELGDSRVQLSTIGIAGENTVRYACILNNSKHAAGRSGMGAVMGSKRLKAVAVRGSQEVQVRDREKVLELNKYFAETYPNHPAGSRLSSLGTSSTIVPFSVAGMLPTRNFTTGEFRDAEEIGAEKLHKNLVVATEGCFACPQRCKRVVEAEEPVRIERVYGGPEYESLGALGSACEIGDMYAVTKACELCNRYGLDTISTGLTIAFAMECFENGIITKKDTDGIELRFGNADALVSIVEKIARREGIGDILAEGSRLAAKRFGRNAEQYAMHVKGQELPLHEPRVKLSLSLAYATSPTGADHVRACHDTAFESEGAPLDAVRPLGIIEPVPREDLGPRKVRLFVYNEHIWALWDVLDVCVSAAAPGCVFSLEQVTDLVHAVTGWRTSLAELMKVGERAVNMARVFNVREGFRREDDRLPDRLFEPLGGGMHKGASLNRSEFENALTLYYEMRGWDPKTGIPTRGKLAELDIDWVIEELYPGC